MRFGSAIPILFVRDVAAAATFYSTKLGFEIDFLHGDPPFYGAVCRGDARLHLRFVHRPNFAELAAREEALILASIDESDVRGLFLEFSSSGVDVVQPLVEQPWGGTDFHVRDMDGNRIAFVEYRSQA